MLRKTLLLLALLSLTLLSTGCIQIRLETELNKDGSGKGKVELAISPSVTEVMTRFEDVEDMPETDITNMANLDGAELKAIAQKANVKIKKFKSEVKDGRRTVSMQMEFDSLKDYSWALGHIFDEVGDGFGVFAGEEGQLVFKEARFDFSTLEAGATEEPDLTNPSSETMDQYLEMMDVIKAAAPEVKVVNIVKVPGDVIETDATTQKGRTCTWTLDFAAIMSDKDNLKPLIIFSDKGLNIEPMPAQEF